MSHQVDTTQVGAGSTHDTLATRLARLRDMLHSEESEPSPYRCDRCHDTGWKAVDTDGLRGVVRCDCARRPDYAESVPCEFQAATLANYEPKSGNEAALVRAQKFFAGARDLVLIGGVGAGKTRLACSILNVQPTRGLFARVPMALHQLEPGGDQERRRALEARLCTVPVLVFDDLGAERDMATDFTRRTLYMIYEERWSGGLRTIWTSNKTLPQLAAMQEDDRLTSRLTGRADVVFIGCGDQRVGLRRG